MQAVHDYFAEYPRTLSVKQLQELLGIRRPTVYKWLDEGVVPAYKLGGTWIIFKDEVLEHLRTHRNIPWEGETPRSPHPALVAAEAAEESPGDGIDPAKPAPDDVAMEELPAPPYLADWPTGSA